ncbi:hypothetical protein D3C79_1103180 [compost metagenome]
MFKHTDGNDAVKLQVQVAVVLQQNLDLKTGTALLRQLLLLDGNGDAVHRYPIVFRRILRQPTPATADIQQRHTRF